MQNGGALADLTVRLRELHLNAGEPSTRRIAAGTAGAVSHSTVHQALTGKRLPRWGALELIVEALGEIRRSSAPPGSPLGFRRTARRNQPTGRRPRTVAAIGCRKGRKQVWGGSALRTASPRGCSTPEILKKLRNS